MPTGVEESGAILALIQVGFSLAKTFTTLVGEYREAPDELATLANAIVDTLAHIETIKSLLEENETTHDWNANGIDPATSCLDEAERLVKRIVTLLRKSGADISPNDRIGPEDISISVMRRVAWSRFTGELGKINESLAATRQKMMLILTLYKAFTVQAQRARRKHLDQHSNTSTNTQRATRNVQEESSVAQDPTSGVETSQEVRDESDPETTTMVVPELPVRLDTLDEVDNASHSENTREQNRDAQGTAGIPLKDTKEASEPPRESINATDSSRAFRISRPTDEGSTPTVMKNQNSIRVDQTTEHVEKDEDRENEGPGTTHQHTLSSGREVELHASNDVDEDFNLAQRAQSVAIHRSGKIAKGIKIRFWKTVFGRLILRKKVAAPLCNSTQGTLVRNPDSELVEVSKLWRIGKWSLTKRTGLQTHPIASTKFVSFIVTLAAETHTIVLAHLNRDELNRLSRHATTHDDRPEANLTSRIYASLPTYTHREVDRKLELKRIESRCHSRRHSRRHEIGHEIIYVEILGMKIFKVRRMRIEEEEQQRREDDADDDEEVDLFGNSLGLSDNELVQRLLEMYTNTHSSLEARSEEAADEAQGHGVPP
ncbi:hypothetical protein KC330_g5389 [Hortaea werneckii]|nr:hypothetical protein KC330_g5389 [Hortaea werneckii]